MSESPARRGPLDGDVLEVVGRSWGWILFFGIATLILGILVTIHPENTVFVVSILIGIWLFVSGLFRIVLAIADREDPGGARWLMAALGILSVLIGLLFLRRTFETVATLAVLLGIFWVVGGLIEFFSAHGRPGSPGRGWRMAMGLLGFAAGVVTLFIPGLTVVVLATVMGIWLMIYGVLQIVVAYRLRQLTRG